MAKNKALGSRVKLGKVSGSKVAAGKKTKSATKTSGKVLVSKTVPEKITKAATPKTVGAKTVSLKNVVSKSAAPGAMVSKTVKSVNSTSGVASVESIRASKSALKKSIPSTVDTTITSVPVEKSTKAEKPPRVKEGLSKSALRKLEQKIREEGIDGGKRWQTLYDQCRKMKPSNYDMAESYEATTPIQHKVLGWGLVLDVKDNRIEVLFKDGIKTLIMNYRR